LISIEVIDRKHCEALSLIVSTDTELARHLYGQGKAPAPTSEYEFFEQCKRWEHKNGGFCYAVLLDGVAIGTASYVPIRGGETAGVGFYISSKYWGKGYGTELLNELKNTLKEKGFKYITGNMPKSNIASKRVFEKCGAKFKECGDRVYSVIELQ